MIIEVRYYLDKKVSLHCIIHSSIPTWFIVVMFKDVRAPMSLVKNLTPLDVKLLWAQYVKGSYNRMEPFRISK